MFCNDNVCAFYYIGFSYPTWGRSVVHVLRLFYQVRSRLILFLFQAFFLLIFLLLYHHLLHLSFPPFLPTPLPHRPSPPSPPCTLSLSSLSLPSFPFTPPLKAVMRAASGVASAPADHGCVKTNTRASNTKSVPVMICKVKQGNGTRYIK